MQSFYPRRRADKVNRSSARCRGASETLVAGRLSNTCRRARRKSSKLGRPALDIRPINRQRFRQLGRTLSSTDRKPLDPANNDWPHAEITSRSTGPGRRQRTSPIRDGPGARRAGSKGSGRRVTSLVRVVGSRRQRAPGEVRQRKKQGLPPTVRLEPSNRTLSSTGPAPPHPDFPNPAVSRKSNG